ncbi:MAG: UPF0175 family protein [Lachnospiraceae bacterium]|nr:UPF0175 family protein [Lachnospiraceae bacterium]MBQ9279249.1 UPF0175 family protein [Lachnospiraceae bacterium]
MCQIAFNIPNEILYDTRQSEEEAIQFVRRSAALNYYVKRGVSLGYAAQIADMDKESFIKYLGENGISIFKFDNEAEFLEEVRNA